MKPIRVLIADDQMMVRQGFSVLLNAEPDIEVVGMAVDGLEAVGKVAELAPDVVLMDIRMPNLGGIEATRRITEPVGATVKVLVLTTFDLDEYVYEALRAPLRERVGDLTERETEVLSLIAQGLSNAEIAVSLVLAEQTVKSHVSRILVKLGLRDRTQAAVFAYETGLIRPSSY